MAKKQFKVDVSGFGAVVKNLSRLSGAGFKATMKAEVGHILRASIQKTKVADTKKIVGRTMPEGYKVSGLSGIGKRLVTEKDGLKYHAGQLIEGPKGKRGGSTYLRPRSRQSQSDLGQRWMSKNLAGGGSNEEWQNFVHMQENKTVERNAKRGVTAGIFYAMAVKGSIKFPRGPKQQKVISSPKVQKIALKYVNVKEVGLNNEYSILLESTGFKMAKWNHLQSKLLNSTSGRIKYFNKNMKNGFTDQIKKLMPARYPLIFK